MMIDLAKEFSAHPSGRVPGDGKFNGETFRRELLLPLIEEIISGSASDQEIIVDIDGVRAFGSSFLEEAFGGLAREEGLDAHRAIPLIRINCTKTHLSIYKDAIEDYLKDALKNAA